MNNKPVSRGPQTEVECTRCGRKVLKFDRNIRKYKKMFCSVSCRDAYQREESLRRGTAVKKECCVCGSMFVVPKSNVFRYSTCSRKCLKSKRSRAGNGNWKGGITSDRKADLTRARYRRWRKAVFERDGFTCQGCGKRGGELCADHIKSWAHNPDIRYSVNNGRTLCVPCHKLTYYYNLRRKLSDRQVVAIVEGKKSGSSSIELSKQFGVSVSLVDRIVAFKSYRHATAHLFGKYFPKTAEERLERRER